MAPEPEPFGFDERYLERRFVARHWDILLVLFYAILSPAGDTMIWGAHMIIYSTDAEADRAFFRDILGFRSVDAGQGWLIFALPPAEVAIHPAEENGKHEIYLMCDDLAAAVQTLKKHKVKCSKVSDLRWGLLTHLTLPGGGQLGLYQPKHPVAARRPRARRGKPS